MGGRCRLEEAQTPPILKVGPVVGSGERILSLCLIHTIDTIKSALGRVCNTHSSSKNISFWI